MVILLGVACHPLLVGKVATHQSKKKTQLFPDFPLTVKQFSLAVQDDYSGYESTKIRMTQIIFKTELLAYKKTSINKIICSNLKIKFPDFSVTLKRDLEIL